MDLQETELTAREFVGVREFANRDAIGQLFERALPQIFGYLGGAGIQPAGPPLGVYYSVTEDGFEMAVAVPVSEPIPEGGPLSAGKLPGGRAVTSTYEGHYEGLSAAWTEFNQAVDDAGHERRSPSWEDYVIGPPDEEDPSRWKTVLVQPIV